MTDEEKLYQAYYQPERLWTGNKVIKELYKITSMPKKDIKSWLAKGNKSSSLRCDKA